MAREHGLSPDPSLVQTVQITIDALVGVNAIPFWRALLGYQDRGDSPEDLIDPRWRGPSIWFQEMDARARNETACIWTCGFRRSRPRRG